MDDLGNLQHGDKTGDHTYDNNLLIEEDFKMQSANKNTIEKRSLHVDY